MSSVVAVTALGARWTPQRSLKPQRQRGRRQGQGQEGKGGGGRRDHTEARLTGFPTDYGDVIWQAQRATNAALNDGVKLLEIEFPTAGVRSTAGDGEGGSEMTASMRAARDLCEGGFGGDYGAESVRVFFPDANELSEAKRSLFRSSPCRLSHLTSPSGLSEIPGFSDRVDFGKKDDDNRGEWEEDKVFFVAYPHFNVNEMIAVQELYESIALPGNQSLIVLNGELDRVRSGYYPRFFYPKLGRMRDDFLPKFETVYYVHNFKGREGGALFRVYPEAWQVYKTEYGTNRLQLVHTQEEMPSLKEVALDILPAVGRR